MIHTALTKRIVTARVSNDVKELAEGYALFECEEDHIILEMSFLNENFLNRKTDACKDLKVLMMQATADKAEFIYLT